MPLPHNLRRRAAAGSQYALIVGLIGVVALAATASLGSNGRILMERIAGTLCNTSGTSGCATSNSSGGSGPTGSPPVLITPLSNWDVSVLANVPKTMPAGSFTGTSLTYTATLPGNAPLPSWLIFNPSTLTFSGTPPISAGNSTLNITVTASNAFGPPASTTATLTINGFVPGANITMPSNDTFVCNSSSPGTTGCLVNWTVPSGGPFSQAIITVEVNDLYAWYSTAGACYYARFDAILRYPYGTTTAFQFAHSLSAVNNSASNIYVNGSLQQTSAPNQFDSSRKRWVITYATTGFSGTLTDIDGSIPDWTSTRTIAMPALTSGSQIGFSPAFKDANCAVQSGHDGQITVQSIVLVP